MTKQQHPITPPPELVQQWVDLLPRAITAFTAAAQWGADQELEACCEWVGALDGKYGPRLRLARRPKPPSLKQQALTLIDKCTDPEGDYLDDNALSTIRRALEALPDD